MLNSLKTKSTYETIVHKQYCVQSTNSKIHLPVSYIYDVKVISIKLSMHLYNDSRSVRPLFLIFMASATYIAITGPMCRSALKSI